VPVKVDATVHEVTQKDLELQEMLREAKARVPLEEQQILDGGARADGDDRGPHARYLEGLDAETFNLDAYLAQFDPRSSPNPKAGAPSPASTRCCSPSSTSPPPPRRPTATSRSATPTSTGAAPAANGYARHRAGVRNGTRGSPRATRASRRGGS
jgi:hypothetical protein